MIPASNSTTTHAARRLMLVHAHPDDETSSTGGTIAKYVAEGAAVTLVTCTLGEMGEVLIPELVHLRHDDTDNLAPHRLAELDAAMAHLGVTDYVRLGGDGRWRDSGMATDESGAVVPTSELHDDSFWRADLLTAANELVRLIRDRRPQVLITYDEQGHYGHPDHIQAHRVATYARHLAAVDSYRRDLGEPWQVARLLWTAFSENQMAHMFQALQDTHEAEVPSEFEQVPPWVVPDSDLAVTIDGYPYAAQRFSALRAHASQIQPTEFFFAFEGSGPGPVWCEGYRLADGPAYPDGATDLFAGLDDAPSPG